MKEIKQDYTKLWDNRIIPQGGNGTACKGKSGHWHNARPLPYYGFFYRIRDAWNVLWLKADALYWTADLDK